MEINYTDLNGTELSELVRKIYGRRIHKRKSTLLLALLNGEKIDIQAEELTRKRLQTYVDSKFEALQTNLPCLGTQTAGKCSKHHCSDMVHASCLSGAKIDV